MNTTALIVMIIAMTLIWGGLIASVVHLIKNPDIEMDKVPNN
ncbi:Putative methionine and alanine importer, small subunit [Moraxella cuniculi DSM 21768]|uniref:Methionine and alanine importer, small subunit n=2 Tax=Moraxella cuniculi TaxID=34061 RepID=A0A3S4R109_9GAMM|nr:methionine/alanine import family NSS transporter small subunit [Moraxella cuniculi]OOS08016.1 hypothetical protein B0189_01360 [Moraxella cuniculi]SIR74314.1 Putative methionine and alanine importer, small subunit [Moraxella cuniculi DSM 21768]VEG13138.1 Uncharacterised protein [Moraxella cuniculi]